jgi:hypothetical protein
MKKPLTKEKFDDCSDIQELKAYLDLRQDERITWPQIWKAGGVKTSPDSPEEQYECYLKWHRQYFSKLGQYLR